MKFSVEPLEDRILVKPIKEEENQTTESGIITDMVKKQTQRATVFAVGAGRYASETGTFIPTILHKGDTVLIASGYGQDIDTEEEKGLKLMRESDVLMVISKK